MTQPFITQQFANFATVVWDQTDPLGLFLGHADAASGVTIAGGEVCKFDSSGNLTHTTDAWTTELPVYIYEDVYQYSNTSVVTFSNANGDAFATGHYGYIPATAGFEIVTTKYDSTSGVSYAVNTLLTPCTATAKVGKVKPAATAYSLKTVCGVVTGAVASYKPSGTQTVNVLRLCLTWQPPVKTS